MIVPTQVPFATIPFGGVWSQDMSQFLVKRDNGDSCNLATGANLGATASPPTAWYFPNATLILG